MTKDYKFWYINKQQIVVAMIFFENMDCFCRTKKRHYSFDLYLQVIVVAIELLLKNGWFFSSYRSCVCSMPLTDLIWYLVLISLTKTYRMHWQTEPLSWRFFAPWSPVVKCPNIFAQKLFQICKSNSSSLTINTPYSFMCTLIGKGT